jgi:hypothetical protein
MNGSLSRDSRLALLPDLSYNLLLPRLFMLLAFTSLGLLSFCILPRIILLILLFVLKISGIIIPWLLARGW